MQTRVKRLIAKAIIAMLPEKGTASPMRILVEILHPAHVHFFRNAIRFWIERGDAVCVLSREKECANELLKACEIPFNSISVIGSRRIGLAWELLVRDLRMWRICRSFRPDILTGIMGVTIAQVGRLIRKPAVVFYDTENATLTNRFVYPLAHSVCTPDCYRGAVRGRHVTYPGYHELAYLHPNRFTPDEAVLRRHGIKAGERFFVVRLVSWQASHDMGQTGLSPVFMEQIIERLRPHGRVLLSSEKPLPPSLETHRFRCPPETMHHFLAFAELVIGESATMASESAVLGTPAFFISDVGRGYTDEQETRYGLAFNFKRRDEMKILRKLDELLKTPGLKSVLRPNHRRLLADKIDTTAWMIEYLDTVLSKIE